MKANAPEKIYVVIDHIWGSMSVNYNRNDTNNVEYTRTDAFIEKAAKWINEHTSLSEKLVVENFVNYMKGE